ncbi:putative invertase inhibitor [Silene latifolia]|uniref:putative invertase inhibitor n=1 Tax=Silene latifolia TaxID=37657 RepID=UPI003D779AAF
MTIVNGDWRVLRKFCLGFLVSRYEFCIKVLGSDPRSSTSTLEQLAEISFQMDISKAKSVTTLIQKLLNDPKLVIPVIKRALQDCLRVYSDASDELMDGLAAVKVKDYKTANMKGSVALTSAETCKEVFQNGQGINPSPSPTPLEVDF